MNRLWLTAGRPQLKCTRATGPSESRRASNTAMHAFCVDASWIHVSSQPSSSAVAPTRAANAGAEQNARGPALQVVTSPVSKSSRPMPWK